jgi:uncharacterized protein YcfJ
MTMAKDISKDINKDARKQEARDANRDPITKTPGAHPVGTGVGAAAGGAAGIAAGAAASAATGVATGTVMGGPVGAAVGLVAGAVAGGLAGKAVAEKIDPTKEEQFWRESFRNEPYYDKSFTYDDYSPAYRTGYEGFNRYGSKPFDEIETELQQEYTTNRGQSRLEWDQARPATRAAWDRVSSPRSTTQQKRKSRVEEPEEAE